MHLVDIVAGYNRCCERSRGGDFVFVKLRLVPSVGYDWPLAIGNNGAVGKSRYKGNQARLGPRSLSYSRCLGAGTATADNIVPECRGHFQTHRTMLLAYVNANFVRDKVTRSDERDGRTARGEERLCHFETHFNGSPGSRSRLVSAISFAPRALRPIAGPKSGSRGEHFRSWENSRVHHPVRDFPFPSARAREMPSLSLLS